MRKIIFFALACVLFAACGDKADSIEAIQERAGLTAQEYYKLLLEDKYEDFVSGMDGGDSLPAGYREQMVANTAMFVKQQKDEHKGLQAVSVERCVADTAAHTAEAILNIEYADNAKEVICVPLVERNGNWYMK